MFSDADRERIAALLRELAAGSVDEGLYAELRQLNAAQASAKAKRAGEIAKIVQTIVSLGVDIEDISSAFPDSRLREWATERGLGGGRRVARGIRSAKATKTTTKSGELLLEVMHSSGKGIPARLYKGQRLPPFVPSAFKTLFNSAGANFEKELAKHFTPEGTSFFASPEGKPELARFLRFVEKRKLKPQ